MPPAPSPPSRRLHPGAPRGADAASASPPCPGYHSRMTPRRPPRSAMPWPPRTEGWRARARCLVRRGGRGVDLTSVRWSRTPSSNATGTPTTRQRVTPCFSRNRPRQAPRCDYESPRPPCIHDEEAPLQTPHGAAATSDRPFSPIPPTSPHPPASNPTMKSARARRACSGSRVHLLRPYRASLPPRPRIAAPPATRASVRSRYRGEQNTPPRSPTERAARRDSLPLQTKKPPFTALPPAVPQICSREGNGAGPSGAATVGPDYETEVSSPFEHTALPRPALREPRVCPNTQNLRLPPGPTGASAPLPPQTPERPSRRIGRKLAQTPTAPRTRRDAPLLGPVPTTSRPLPCVASRNLPDPPHPTNLTRSSTQDSRPRNRRMRMSAPLRSPSQLSLRTPQPFPAPQRGPCRNEEASSRGSWSPRDRATAWRPWSSCVRECPQPVPTPRPRNTGPAPSSLP